MWLLHDRIGKNYGKYFNGILAGTGKCKRDIKKIR